MGIREDDEKRNLVLRADIAVKRDVYLQEFFGNRSLSKEQRLREVYLDELYIHEHYHRFEDSLWDLTDDQDVKVWKNETQGTSLLLPCSDPRTGSPP